jgi:hypothetical protein
MHNAQFSDDDEGDTPPVNHFLGRHGTLKDQARWKSYGDLWKTHVASRSKWLLDWTYGPHSIYPNVDVDRIHEFEESTDNDEDAWSELVNKPPLSRESVRQWNATEGRNLLKRRELNETREESWERNGWTILDTRTNGQRHEDAIASAIAPHVQAKENAMKLIDREWDRQYGLLKELPEQVQDFIDAKEEAEEEDEDDSDAPWTAAYADWLFQIALYAHRASGQPPNTLKDSRLRQLYSDFMPKLDKAMQDSQSLVSLN